MARDMFATLASPSVECKWCLWLALMTLTLICATLLAIVDKLIGHRLEAEELNLGRGQDAIKTSITKLTADVDGIGARLDALETRAKTANKPPTAARFEESQDALKKRFESDELRSRQASDAEKEKKNPDRAVEGRRYGSSGSYSMAQPVFDFPTRN
ncbi:hypothetical protein ISF_02250 [Cordyceps fumosorosea ARSEF 2679]|uniref:Uncharacterized protein n=1 Tax=Cordyceps fumosorosea (strain ARSEF 2679) TaxID=1081104 RepID=A0A168BLL2_CORFA|nr:hypothetical protein ISF_02250 [Cordyceps fumosorosea ARSEF 2679]OAA70276.1 hypothetical protein ISF_02250 [Cordyceps fumosorosea ARSEF 2679]